ncbi:MAG: molybdenum cofactor guanylyltransferase [Ferruginibacter sp.]|nr:molybdenum cofactor guanylyltransferase [Ferruginibacter sp.]
MIGIILCGGQSTRMNNNDKGLVLLNTKTLTHIAFESLSRLSIPILISINEHQEINYANKFNSNLLIIDNPSLSIKGPLRGILSAHLQNPNDDFFILACDLPLIDFHLLKELFIKYQQNKSFDAFVFTNDNEMEPLCGIYTTNALQKTIALYSGNKLIKNSMKFVLSNLNVYTIKLAESQKRSFKNFNTISDLDGI